MVEWLVVSLEMFPLSFWVLHRNCRSTTAELSAVISCLITAVSSWISRVGSSKTDVLLATGKKMIVHINQSNTCNTHFKKLRNQIFYTFYFCKIGLKLYKVLNKNDVYPRNQQHNEDTLTTFEILTLQDKGCQSFSNGNYYDYQITVPKRISDIISTTSNIHNLGSAETSWTWGFLISPTIFMLIKAINGWDLSFSRFPKTSCFHAT